jgi:DNA-binding transcriptional LysR family regulator
MKADLSGLEALEAVVKFGGFSRAATHLHKVQSAVSHQVSKLEKQLGVQLLTRDGYRVRLTPAGETILAEGRRLIAQADRVRFVAKQFAEGWEPQLLIVIDGIVPLDPTLAAVRMLTAERLPTRIQVSVEFLRGVQQRFQKDQADLMLVADYKSDPYLQEEALPDVTCILCVGRSHPLANLAAVSLAQLQDHVELSVQRSSDEQDSDQRLFGCERRVYLPSFQTKREALLLGVGFGWMPLHLVRLELKSGRLTELQYVGGTRYRFTPKLVYRSSQPLGRAASQFVALLKNAPWPRVQAMQSRRRGKGS